MGVMDFFPAGKTPYPEQRAVLEELERRWNMYDVFVVTAPTASGKTILMRTLADWRADAGNTSNILAPNNAIIEQIRDAFPGPILRRKAAYRCVDHKMSCADMMEEAGKPCERCPYMQAKHEVKSAPVRYANYYVYWSARMYADVALFDEAHQLVDMMQGRTDIKLRKSKYNFPETLRTLEDVVVWGQEALRSGADQDLARALNDLLKVKDGAVVSYDRRQRDTALWVQAKGAQVANYWLWPRGKVKKVVLFSATLSSEDIRELGLDKKRVTYLEMPSIIPAERRRLVFEPAVKMSMRCRDVAIPILARRIEDLLEIHPEKGLIHAPYAIVEQLQQHLTDPRLRFHTRERDNKAAALKAFREAPDDSGMVLVACGLYEGIDLPYDAARWQVLTTVPFLNLGDARTEDKAKENPVWYDWEAIKKVIQATGRIVRAPDDFGVTYLFDNNFERLLRADARRTTPLIPTYFREAMKILPFKGNDGTHAKKAPVPVRRRTS